MDIPRHFYVVFGVRVLDLNLPKTRKRLTSFERIYKQLTENNIHPPIDCHKLQCYWKSSTELSTAN